MKIHHIVPQAITQPHNNEAARQGEACHMLNMREREQALEVVGKPHTVAHIAAGSQLLVVDQDRYIYQQGRRIVHDKQVIATATGNITAAHVVGPVVIVDTSSGPLYLHYNAGQYRSLVPARAIPQLHLAATEWATLTTNIESYSFKQPLARWQFPLSRDEITPLCHNLAQAHFSLTGQAGLEGRYCSPILARYGVRLWDDSYLWISAPVLLGSNAFKKNYRTATQAMTDGKNFTGIGAFQYKLSTYRLGITVLKGVAPEWHDLVKSIDIFTSLDTQLAHSSQLDYRMGIATQPAGRIYSIELGLSPRSHTSIVDELLNRPWYLATSCHSLQQLAQGKLESHGSHIASTPIVPNCTTHAIDHLPQGTPALSHEKCKNMVWNSCHLLAPASALVHNGRHYCAGGQLLFHNPWPMSALFDGNMAPQPCHTRLTLTLKTHHGTARQAIEANYNFTPQQLNAMWVACDSRVVAMKCEITSAGITKVASCTLNSHEPSGTTIAVQHDLMPVTLIEAQSTSNTNDTPPHVALNASNLFTMSHTGNPLVHTLPSQLTGATIVAVAIASKPIYTSAFGHYPIYLFTRQGLFAVPQRSSGDYGEARLVDHKILAQGFSPVHGGNKVWFKNHLGMLCSVAGAKVTIHSHQPGLSAIAWNDAEQELWLLNHDTSTGILFGNNHSTQLSFKAKQFYCQPTFALMINEQGEILDMQQADAVANQHFSYMSHPFMLNKMPTQITWNCMAGPVDLTLTLRGERGNSCHGYIINCLHATGAVNAPISTSLLTPPCRTLRLEVDGVAPSGTLLRPTLLS